MTLNKYLDDMPPETADVSDAAFWQRESAFVSALARRHLWAAIAERQRELARQDES